MPFWFAILTIASFAAYAALLEWAQRRWPQIEPDATWAEVMAGIAIVGGIVAWILHVSPPMTAWECWNLWFYTFCFSAVPVVAWQLYQTVDRIADVGRRRRGHVDPAPLAEERRSQQDGDD